MKKNIKVLFTCFFLLSGIFFAFLNVKAAENCRCTKSTNNLTLGFTDIVSYNTSDEQNCNDTCYNVYTKTGQYNFGSDTNFKPITSPIIKSSSGPTQFNYTMLEGLPGFISPKQIFTDLPGLVLSIYKFGIWTVGIAGLFMIVIGGIMYMTSAGNTSSANSAKGIIWDAIFGIIGALSAYLFMYVINPDLVKINLNFTPVTVQEIGPGPSTSGSGNCKPITNTNNPCSVDKLKFFAVNKGYNETDASNWAEKASSICNAESGGNPLAASGGKCNGTSIAWGLFQINLNAWCNGAFTTNWNRSAGFTNGGCQIKDQTIFDNCKAKAVDINWNINKAWELYQKSGGWKPWEVTLNGQCPSWTK